MIKKFSGTYYKALSVAVLLGVCSAPASAYSLYAKDGNSLDFNVEVGLGLFHSGHSYAQVRTKPSSPTWSEGYARYGFSAKHSLDKAGSLYGTLNLVTLGTRGDGDAAGFTTGHELKTTIGEAFVGWRSADLFPALGHDGVDLSFGRQSFVLGDGFLINGDALNFGKGFDPLADQGIAPRGLNRGGAYWFGGSARRSFADTAVLKLGTDKGWRAQGFWLSSSNKAQASMSLAGVDLRYADPKYGALAVSYLHGLSVDHQAADFLGLQKRDGQDTYALRGHSSFGISSLMLSGEYVFQNNHQYGRDHAWYAEGSWTFASIPWSPAVDYRYSHFSDGFDPLFYGFNSGYGTWFQGEVASNYAGPFNTGSTIQQVKLTASPRHDLGVGALYFNYSDTPGGHLNGHEVDLYAQWTVNDHLMISPVFGFYSPDKSAANGGSQLGNNNTNFYQQVIAIVTF